MATVLERVRSGGLASAKSARQFPRLTRAEVVDTMWLTSGFYEITPDVAKWILETRNTRNRRLIESTIGKVSTDLRDGNWAINGTAIVFANDGVLNDGQNRLTAIHKTGISAVSNVVFGVEPDTQDTLDQTRPRTLGHVFEIAGMPNANMRAAIVRMVLAYEAMHGKGFAREDEATPSRAKARLAEDSRIGECAARTHHLPRAASGVVSPSLAGFWLYLIGTSETGVEYFNQVVSGENIGRDDVAWRVRERLLGMESKARFPRTEAFLRGWVAYRDGRPLKLVKVLGELPEL